MPVDRAHEVIAGYTITNDVSVRDWQLRTPTMTMGKSFDTHGPLGPWIVTRNELGDPHDLAIRTYVNDELRQDGNTREMIYDCYEQVAHLSEAFTLEPGDVIATGTPAGIGAVRQPFPEGLLKVGDVVRVEIEGIGELQQHGDRGARRVPRARGRGGVRMGSLSDEIRDFLDANPVGVLATEAADGRPRQSLVYFARDGERAADFDADRPAQGPRRPADGLGLAVRDGPSSRPIRRPRSRARRRSSPSASGRRRRGSCSASAALRSRRSR